MTETQCPEPPVCRRSVIGRHCLIRDHKHQHDREFYGATVIDADHENHSKRVRLTTGPFANEVLMRGEYDVLEFTD